MVAATGLSLLAGQALDRPVLLGYVTTGSMAPTLAPGDGFVAVPVELSGPIEAGDVVVFRATTVGGGGLTTHRVAAVTDAGLVTIGDANPVTDQSGGEPLVAPQQVVATALRIHGTVVVLPELGTAVEVVRGVATGLGSRVGAVLGLGTTVSGFRGTVYVLVAAAVLVTAIDAVFADGRRDRRIRRRDRDDGLDPHPILLTLATVVAVVATAAMVLPAGPYAFDGVSSAVDSERPGVIRAGETETATYVVRNGGLVPAVVFLEPGDGVAVERTGLTVAGREFVNVTVALTAPAETGPYRLYLVEHRYLAVLPEPVLARLFAVHPWLPVAAVDATLAVPLYLLGRALVGTGHVRSRSRTGPPRLRRLLARIRWYVR